VLSWRHDVPASRSIGALLLVAIPMGELAITVLRRARARVSVLAGDRSHVYDQLVERGWSALAAVLALVLLQGALVGMSLVAARLSKVEAAAVVVVWALGLLGVATAAGFL